jgi:hypothetical protein
MKLRPAISTPWWQGFRAVNSATDPVSDINAMADANVVTA